MTLGDNAAAAAAVAPSLRNERRSTRCGSCCDNKPCEDSRRCAFIGMIGLVSGLSMLLLIGFQARVPGIVFEFPDNFRGTVILKGEDPMGVTVRATNGIIMLSIPASGVLSIQGKLPTHDWHSPSARYA